MPRRTIAGDLPAPMLAKPLPELPEGEGWTYEPKWDGFRAIVAVADGGAPRVVSRDGRPLGRYFPELVAELDARRAGSFVADGEIVRIREGSMEFEELQLRLHPAESRVRRLSGEIPASLVLFDLLSDGDDDLLEVPLAARRTRLATRATAMGWPEAPGDLGSMPPPPSVAIAPWTDDTAIARAWFDDEDGLGQDGLLAKRADQPYLAGERGWVKVKHRRTLDVVVGGYRLSKAGDGIGALLLGLYDGDTLHYVGHTSSFRAAQRREMLEVLHELEGGESFGRGRGPGGQSRWSGGKDTAWVPLQPVLVCEVTIDRIQYGRIRHAATFVGWRDDREPTSCTFEQVGAEPPSWPEPPTD